MRIQTVITASLLLVSPASAQFYDGNNLHDLCRRMPVQVSGYVAGFFDKADGDVVLAEFWAPTRENKDQLKTVIRPYCVGDGVRLSQLTDVVCKYLADFPQKRHVAATIIVPTALSEAFPCKGQ